MLEQNSIELHYNDIKSYINIGNAAIALNVRDWNQTPSLLEKTLKGHRNPTLPMRAHVTILSKTHGTTTATKLLYRLHLP